MYNKKIFVIHAVAVLGGGVFSVVKNLISEQKKENILTGIVFRESDKDFLNDIIFENIIKICCKKSMVPGENLLRGLLLKKIYYDFKKKYPDYQIIIHAHNPVSIGLLGDIRGINLILSIHGKPCGSYISRKISDMIIARTIKNKYTIVGVSAETANYYNLKFDTTKIQVVRNGVNVASETSVINKNESEKFSVGYVSYLDELKGWKYVVQAYKELPDIYKQHIKLHLVGKVDQKDKPKLDRMLEDTPVSQIEYYGFINNAGDSVTPYLDLIILPSLSEGIPMCLLEALANSVPILATNVGGIPEILKDSYNGFFIERDAKIIQKRIMEIYDNPKLYQEMRLHAKESYELYFSAKKMYGSYLYFYEKIIEGVI